MNGHQFGHLTKRFGQETHYIGHLMGLFGQLAPSSSLYGGFNHFTIESSTLLDIINRK
ncbi:hypothetical protein H0266_05810 [Halobacillus locisalis]|uniref:Uncharacterized protein n=1 Tax=Halobacillus locisalis TaxID=220753 RepID=A0A838CQZ6_9BACI|nr:hypothetical protein [Halobacillus locisalis]MBA2174420.1 hypothetical protein [Halobacillus locisalis]